LLPLSIKELAEHGIEYETFEEYCFRGFLPRIYDKSQRPGTAYSNYYRTYVERDVRLLINLRDLSLFEKLLRLLAGRVGQLMDYSSLAGDVGVDAKTVRSWLSILEASFILFKLPPYFENLGKRTIKAPKYYFTDVGLLCFLLGIRQASQATRDPLVGNIFENLVVMECLKTRYNKGAMADLYFFRDSNGNEVDIVHPEGRDLTAIEIKSAATFTPDFLKGPKKLKKNVPSLKRAALVYNGVPLDLSDGISAVHFKGVHKLFD
jgi:predicted AAA+ superfamily ATPase